jgi:hypothetical protein
MTSDGAREFSEAIAALRAIWLSERRANETVGQWLHRTGRARGYLA